MPNAAHDHPSEPEPSDTAGTVFGPSVSRRSRRTRIAAGVVGLAGLLGGGAYVAIDKLAPTTTEVGINKAVALPPEASTSDDPSASPTTPAKGAKTGDRPKAGTPPTTAAPVASEAFHTAAERVAAARAAAAKDGVKVIHPRTPTASPAAVAAAAAAHVENIGSVKQGSTMRVITAKMDLTGLREQGWVAGGVTSYGPVDCSQTFRFGNEQKPAKKENLLVCWRTSAKKSVITVTVDTKGHPSVAKSVAAIDQRWRQMH